MAALVLVPGLARTGKDDPRLVAFATSLARVRFRGLGSRRLKACARSKFFPPTSTRWRMRRCGCRKQAHLTGGQPVGIVAISYAAGPALLAATTERGARRCRLRGLGRRISRHY